MISYPVLVTSAMIEGVTHYGLTDGGEGILLAFFIVFIISAINQ